MKINKIEVVFPLQVEMSNNLQQELCEVIRKICKEYEKNNPGRAMWPSGIGSKMLSNPFMDLMMMYFL